ncbi:5476_t:CDS:2, partial [Dentiscutata erythropus]
MKSWLCIFTLNKEVTQFCKFASLFHKVGVTLDYKHASLTLSHLETTLVGATLDYKHAPIESLTPSPKFWRSNFTTLGYVAAPIQRITG